jgi:hypothetical protein
MLFARRSLSFLAHQPCDSRSYKRCACPGCGNGSACRQNIPQTNYDASSLCIALTTHVCFNDHGHCDLRVFRQGATSALARHDTASHACEASCCSESLGWPIRLAVHVQVVALPNLLARFKHSSVSHMATVEGISISWLEHF